MSEGSAQDVLARWRPLIAAEQARGNSFVYALTERQYRETRMPHALARHPFDMEAIHAEFELPADLHVTDDGSGRVWLYEGEGRSAVFEGRQPRGWLARRKQRSWWRSWSAAPRERIVL